MLTYVNLQMSIVSRIFRLHIEVSEHDQFHGNTYRSFYVKQKFAVLRNVTFFVVRDLNKSRLVNPHIFCTGNFQLKGLAL